MNPSGLVLTLIFIVNALLSVLVFSKNRRSVINIIFSLFIFSIGIWSLSLALIQFTAAMIWSHVTMISGVGMGTFFLVFSKVFPKNSNKTSRFTLSLFIFPALIIIILELFNLIVKGIEIKEGIATPVLGSLYPLFMIYVIGYASYAIISLALKYKRSAGISRMQLKYLFLGFSGFVVAIIITNIVLPAIGVTGLTFLAPAFSLLLILSILYSIIKHRLMDIRIVLKKIVLYSLVSFVLLIFILGSIFSVAYFYAKRIPDYSLVFTGSFAMVVALLFLNPLNRFFERVANRYFFTSLYNYQATLEDLATKLTAVIEMPKVIDLIVSTTMQTMGLDRAGVLLLSNERNADKYNIAKVIGFNEQGSMSLVRDNFLIQWLASSRKIVVYEELDWLIEESRSNGAQGDLMRLKVNMKKIEASLCIPLFSKNSLISIIVLGNKVTRDAYNVEDFRLLQSIANQAAISVQNARLYAQVQDFSQTLQGKVQVQTKDIADKNIQLEKLLKAQSEFLDIASHQLRTPVSVIRGVISMIQDGDMVKLPKEKQVAFIDSAAQKGAKLDQIINDILAASELDSNKFTVDATTPRIQLENAVDRVVKSFQLEAEQREIDLRWRLPKTPLPQVVGNDSMLEQAITNFISNALKYTPSTEMVKEARAKRSAPGLVKIEVKKIDKDIVVSVSDNGIGIPEAEVKKLFHKFTRASNATAMYTDGSGLGLFIVKEIIDGHNGRAWVESAEGKGSTFCFSLPVAGQTSEKALQ